MSTFYIQFLYFVIYSFIGWCCETTYCSVLQKQFVNRGFLNGPFCPIYGFGELAIVATLTPFVHNIPLLFLFSIIITSIMEYCTSFILEKIFNMTWWDYSKHKFNIHGRVCLENSLMFGVLSLIVMLIVHPIVVDFINSISKNVLFIFAISIEIYFVLDLVITVHTILQLNGKLKQINLIIKELKDKKEYYKLITQETIENKLESLVENRLDTLEDRFEILKEKENYRYAKNRIDELKNKLNTLLSNHKLLHRRIIKAFPNISSNKHTDILNKIKENIISNAEALKFYAQFADVVVLARELNLEQVAEIYRQIQEEHICGPNGEQIRIEMFCHGALCMAVSGKCYLSLHEMNHSANRGACMQVCRRSYTVRDKETDVELDIDNEYIMSPKDLKTIHFMNKMLDAGVRVFKIEGRARGPEYVRTVVECYKEAIKAYLEGTFTDEKITAWDERLKTVFNRGFWDGYYLGQRLGEWTRNYGSAATERKIYVGKGIKYFSNIGVSEFLVEAAEVSVGDKLLITGPTTGALFMTLEEARVDLESVQTVRKGQRFSMKSDKIRPSDKLYKLVSTEELKKFKGLDIEQKRG